jgi:ApbE superfamily uncharacterized protein (UPF0280 family)
VTGAAVQRLPDGRLHLHHGPIDIVLRAWGPPDALAEGERRAVARFATVLEELGAELPVLRRPAPQAPRGETARRMAAATAPHAGLFVTPMAAVAGAVADTVLAALVSGGGIARAFVNDGGDIALHLEPGEALACAIAAGRGARHGMATIRHADPVRGIATSGWRGRSWSFGIADAVTVLARTAAAADAAATLIAGAVDLPGHPTIRRRPARDMQADSDLGHRAVTVAVGPLPAAGRAAALDRGLAVAESMRRRGLVEAAALFLHPFSRVAGALPLAAAAPPLQAEPADA